MHLTRLGGFYKLKGYRHAHAWVGNTHGIQDYLTTHGLPASRVHMIGNFVDTPERATPATLDLLRRQLGLEGCRIILGLGRLHPNKGWADLLHAFAKLPESLAPPPLPNPPPLAGEGANARPKPINAPLHLLMVGDGPLRETLTQLAANLGIAFRVHWAGWQTDPAPYYQLADVFVCASVHEPLGNVILEAWANRSLLVSTRAQGPLELVQDGVNGLLAPLSDAAGLADVLHVALALDHNQKEQIVEAGSDEVERHYSEAAIVSAYTALYSSLLKPATPLESG